MKIAHDGEADPSTYNGGTHISGYLLHFSCKTSFQCLQIWDQGYVSVQTTESYKAIKYKFDPELPGTKANWKTQ